MKDNDIPAFPSNTYADKGGNIMYKIGENESMEPIISGSSQGMTLRDYFAGKSMEAHRVKYHNADSKALARYAYRDADAMLKERDK